MNDAENQAPDQVCWLDASASGAVYLDAVGRIAAVRDKRGLHVVAQQPIPEDRPETSQEVFGGGAIWLRST